MDDFIHNQTAKAINQAPDEFYCSMTSFDYLDTSGNPRSRSPDDPRVLAKKIIRENGDHKLSIKYTSNGRMENPISIYGADKIDNTFLDRVCRSQDKFKEVNPKVFGMYITFLKTHNLAWLSKAERENQ